ncbi:MAG: minichromosome maintenance protein MCM [Candidatus Bathyarchaeota archaeon]|nr:minichromosome maintenance protein MCM [Candidatus Bathyarchaeota archaeon]MDH5532143.1 minichromosome maintenance protein MCM [Candidatus Bathyarchaeota archaeon]MDH5713166.1 minichromosome maintenance protein MCM [Candidatus Bathyarchaeota archaeon]
MTEEALVADPQERFQDFFKSDKYRQRFSEMAIASKTSLVVDFGDLLSTDSALAEDIIERPDQYLEHANRAALAQLQIQEPEYAEEIEKVSVQFKNLPVTMSLRKLGSDHIGTLVMLQGIVVRATPARPMVTRGAFRCRRCGTVAYVDQTTPFLRDPAQCTDPACRRIGPFDFLQEQSTFIDSQEIRIQERPEDLPPGQLPRWINIKLTERDLVDVARPGDDISVVGVVRAVAPTLPRVGKLRVFHLHLDANFVDVLSKEHEAVLTTPEEEKQILELARDPWIHRKIIRSIAPSIYGYDHVKEAIMYLLFGGIPKQFPDINIRGEMNALLIGDPGTAKSQLLQYVARIAPRGLYTSGRGTTAAGLTAAVLRERQGGMTLEAGALVLADKGVACIDEIDKMRPEDRVAIHEAMEQHTVSVAKGGIVATLNARAAILAAGNPALGRYEPYRTVAENIALPVTILSRFDLIFVMRDVPEKELDAKMTDHILRLHRTGAVPVEPPIPADLLRKYVSYAKSFKPVLTDEALSRLRDFYLTMRSASETEGTPIAITARQLESLVRVAEARARIALRKEILAEDAEAAVAIMKRSLEEVGIDVSSQKVDIDLIMTGKPKSLRDKLGVVLGAIVSLEKETGMVEKKALLEKLETEYDVTGSEAERLIGQLLKEGTIYSPREGYLKKT